MIDFLLILGGKPTLVLEAECSRDLSNISGTFHANLAVEVPYALSPSSGLIGKSVEIFVAETKVLTGWVERVETQGGESSLSLSIAGRDVTGDLVDCAVNPQGPLEYRKVKLEDFAENLIKPFGIFLKNQVDTGEPLELIGLEPTDTVLSAIEAQSRQRGILITSDGIGGLLLTKSGSEKANDTIKFPGGKVQSASGSLSQCFSDYYVKGQMHNLERPAQSALNPSLKPGKTNFKQGSKSPQEIELSASSRFGHAHDDGVTRYRPTVLTAKTQSGGSKALQNTSNPKSPQNKRSAGEVWSLNDQAIWRMRTSRAHAVSLNYVIPGFLNEAGELWKPNQLVSVDDNLNNIKGDMLISAVSWSYSNSKCETRLSVVPPDAFDLTGDLSKIPTKGQRSLPKGGK